MKSNKGKVKKKWRINRKKNTWKTKRKAEYYENRIK